MYDEGRAGLAMAAYLTLEGIALGLQAAAEFAEGTAQLAALTAKGAAKAADVAARLADAAAHAAHVLAAVAAQAAAVAAHDDALVARLTAAYAKQQARKLAKAARAVARAVKKVAKKVAHAAVAVAKAAYKYSGAQDVVSCVTNPHLSSCIKAAVTVALVVATAGEGEVEVAAMNAAEEAGARAAEGGSEVLLDTSAVKSLGRAQSLIKPGEVPAICSTVACEAAEKGFSTAGLREVPDGMSAVLRGQVAQQLRGFSAKAQGFDNDVTIGATAIERGSPLITGDRALYNAVNNLGGEARLFRPGG